MKRVDLLSRTTLTRAAAELVLIVTGILIALGIDSALTERRERAMARQSLELITEDLRLLVEQVEEFARYNQDLLEGASAVESALSTDGSVPRTPELWDAVNRLGYRRTLRLPRAAWDELVGTGNLRLLEDPTLRRDLVRFYETLARDEEVVARNNAVYADALGVGVLLGEGIVLSHPNSADIGVDDVGRLMAPNRMAAAGIPFGPSFAGLLWTSEVDDPVRIRTRSVAMAVASVAASAIQMGEQILADAEALLARIEGDAGQ